MARVIEDSLGTILTVDLGVGPNRANNRDDVTVVQYLLNLWLQHPVSALARTIAGTAGSRPLIVDGIIGPKTNACIKVFQKYVNTEPGGSVIVDGRIDRPKSNWSVPGQNKAYAILELNGYARGYYLDHEDITALRFRSDFPPRLVPVINRFVPAWAQWKPNA